jgi:hypothetical protein
MFAIANEHRHSCCLITGSKGWFVMTKGGARKGSSLLNFQNLFKIQKIQ